MINRFHMHAFTLEKEKKMSDVANRYATIAGGFSRRLEGAGLHWSNASPCEGWSARDVAEHVIRTNRAVAARLDDSGPQSADENEDPIDAWQKASSVVQDALADPDRAGTIVGGMFGEQTFEQLVGTLLCADTLVHTWDLAQATGQDDRLDTDAVVAALGFLETIDEQIRAPGGFGPKLEPPAGADSQTAFLCFTGRRP